MAEWLALILSHFDLTMFIIALFFIGLHFSMRHTYLSRAEMVYRWIALFAVGFTSIYAALMYALYPEMIATAMGFVSSPFQIEVAMANLAFGVLGVLSFKASYSFRLATVIGVTCWLWGDALGHLYQLMQNQNISLLDAGSWFWMDMLMPVILIICIIKLRPRKLLFTAKRY